jgi:hypothetical protein
MPATVNVNMMTVVHADSGGILMALPDVCLTPAPPAPPIPIPYPNIAQSQDTSGGSSTVKMDGNSIMVKGASFSKSTGDEAGSVGGVMSGMIQGKAEFLNYSFDVTVEGNNVCRLADLMMSNSKNTPPMPLVQAPLIVLPSLSSDPSEEDWDLTSLDPGHGD